MKDQKTIKELMELKNVEQLIKDNHNVYRFNIIHENKLYEAMLSNKACKFNLWDENGIISLYSNYFNEINENDIIKAIENNDKDLVKCSGNCNHFINPSESHQFFASYYCDECFNLVKEERDWAYAHLD